MWNSTFAQMRLNQARIESLRSDSFRLNAVAERSAVGPMKTMMAYGRELAWNTLRRYGAPIANDVSRADRFDSPEVRINIVH
jgi:hypothetical protein